MIEFSPMPLSLADVKGIMALLADCAEIGPLQDRRRRLLEGLAALCDADVWVWAIMSREGTDIAHVAWMDGGWTSDEQRMLAMAANHSPESASLQPLIVRPEPHYTFCRAEILSQAEWHAHGLYQKFRVSCRLDDFMFCFKQAGESRICNIGLHRAAGKAPFGPRERCLVHLVSGEVHWLSESGVGDQVSRQALRLTPRQRQVLMYLLTGRSTKEIARGTNLSVHTVNDHLKALHRIFGVSSRGELLSQFLGGAITETADADDPKSDLPGPS